MRRALIVVAALAALAGCGGGGKQSLPPGAPKPAQDLSSAVAGFERALAHPTCSGLEPFVHSQERQSLPGEPLRRGECSVLLRNLKTNLSGFHTEGTSQFGTAGLVDAKAGHRTQAAVFALDTDRHWKFVFAIEAGKQLGTSPADPRGFDASATALVHAIATRNCDQLYSFTSLSSPSYQAVGGNKRKYCRSLLHPVDPTTLSAELPKDKKAAPRPMGATRDFAFYALSLHSGRYETLVMITQPNGHRPEELRGKTRYGFLEVYVARQPRG